MSKLPGVQIYTADGGEGIHLACPHWRRCWWIHPGYTLQSADDKKHTLWWKKDTQSYPHCWRWKFIHPHIHHAGGGKENTPTSILLIVDRNTLTSTLLVVKRDTHSRPPLLVVETFALRRPMLSLQEQNLLFWWQCFLIRIPTDFRTVGQNRIFF